MHVNILKMDSDHEEFQYLNYVSKILKSGSKRVDRTGVGTLSLFGTQMRWNLHRNVLPLLTTKRVMWKCVIEELLWFIKGSTDVDELRKVGVNIWNANTSRKYLDENGFIDRDVNDAGPIYGFQWRHYGAKYINKDHDYKNQGIDQLKQIIETIKNNPVDRRIIMTAWNPIDIPKMVLPPCHCFVQFYVNDGKLSAMMYQRSADMGLGVPFNIASYSLLVHMIAHVTNLEAGEFIHTIGDAHVYLNHIEPLKSQLSRTPITFPTLKFSRKINNIDDFVVDDFILENYKPHNKIEMSMAV